MTYLFTNNQEVKNAIEGPLTVAIYDNIGNEGNLNGAYHPVMVEDGRAGYTSKNRLKVSPYQTTFFNTFQYGKETDVWDEYTQNGGSAYWESNTNSVIMVVSNTLGSKVIRQTRNVQRYIPGRTSTLTYAVKLQMPVTGIRRRFGMFNETDGFFFEDAGVIGADNLPEYNVVVRSSASGTIIENRIPRNQWNGDRLNGTGDPVTNPSGIQANPLAMQMVNFEYEWYGAGQIIVGWTINGKTHIIHTFNHANYLELPWAATPFLPIRLELENILGTTGGPHTLVQGSNSLISEGEPDKLGIGMSINTPLTGITLPLGQTYYPVLSIRLKPTALKGIVLPTFFQAACVDTAGTGTNKYAISIAYQLIRNANVSETGWIDMADPNSFTQYKFDGTANLQQGFAIATGYISGLGGGTGIRLDSDTLYQIGRSNLGANSDVLTLAVATLDAVPGVNVHASFNWIEQR